MILQSAALDKDDPLSVAGLGELQEALLAIDRKQDDRRSELASFLEAMEQFGYENPISARANDDGKKDETKLAATRAEIAELDVVLEQKDAEVKRTGNFQSLMADVANAVSEWNSCLSEEALQALDIPEEALLSPKSASSAGALSTSRTMRSRNSARRLRSPKSADAVASSSAPRKTVKRRPSKVSGGRKAVRESKSGKTSKRSAATSRSRGSSRPTSCSSENSAPNRDKSKKWSGSASQKGKGRGNDGTKTEGVTTPVLRERPSPEEVSRILNSSTVVMSSLLPSQESHVARIVEQDVSTVADAYRPDTCDAAKINTIDGDLRKLSTSPARKSKIQTADALSRLSDAPVSVIATNQSIEECLAAHRACRDALRAALNNPIESVAIQAMHSAIRNALASPESSVVALPSLVRTTQAGAASPSGGRRARVPATIRVASSTSLPPLTSPINPES